MERRSLIKMAVKCDQRYIRESTVLQVERNFELNNKTADIVVRQKFEEGTVMCNKTDSQLYEKPNDISEQLDRLRGIDKKDPYTYDNIKPKEDIRFPIDNYLDLVAYIKSQENKSNLSQYVATIQRARKPNEIVAVKCYERKKAISPRKTVKEDWALRKSMNCILPVVVLDDILKKKMRRSGRNPIKNSYRLPNERGIWFVLN